MEIIERKINELIEAEYNPRQITDKQFDQLKDSLKRFGFVDPVLVNMHPDRENIIIGGHMRTKAAKDLGFTEVPCVELNLTYDQEKELNIRLNKNGGSFDMDALANYFDGAVLEEWGFEAYELGDIVTEIEPAEEEEPNLEPPKEPITVLGDLYELNEHRVHCASSTEIDALEKLMGGRLLDLVVTDPPYNVNYTGKTKAALTIKNDYMGDNDFYQFLYDFYTAFGSYTKKGGAWYVWHADSEGANFRKAMSDAGIMVKQCLIWVKNSIVMGRQDYHWKHEPCLYGWVEGAAHNWYSDRKQSTVLEFDKPFRNEDHPTMKPVELIAYQIKNSSKIGDIVGDGFLGSGTTLIASEINNRTCYGQELDTQYCDVIVRRWVKYMQDNNRPYTVKRNGKKLTSEEIERYIS
jgi:DNA modification methylase